MAVDPSALTPDQVEQLTTMEAEGRLPEALKPRLQQFKQSLVNSSAGPGNPAPLGGGSDIPNVIKPEVLPTVASGLAQGVTDVGLAMPHPGIKAAALGTAGLLQYGAGVLAEKLNQKLGITPPDEHAQQTAGVVPATTDTLSRVGSAVLGIKGRKGAYALNNLGLPEIAQRGADFGVTRGAVDQAFNRATQAGQTVPMPATLATLGAHINDLRTRATPPPEAIKIMTNLRNKIVANGGRLTIKDVNDELESLGDAFKMGPGQAENSQQGKLRDIYKDIYSDLHKAPGEQLSGARELYKKHLAMREFVAAGEDAFKNLRGQGGNNSFNAARVMNQLRENPFFMDVMDKNPEIERILTGTLEKLNQIPTLPAPRGVNPGSMKVVQRGIAAGTLGYTTHQASGSQIAGGVAAGVGFAYPEMKDFLQNVWIAANLKKGRQLLDNLMTSYGNLKDAAAPLSAYVHAAMNDPKFLAEQQQ